MSMRRLTITIAALGILAASAASADDEGIDTGFVFDMIGMQYCDAPPSDLTVAEVEKDLEKNREQLPLSAKMTGFMAGDRVGTSYFGTRDGDTSFTAMTSIIGPVEGVGYRTLCLAMIHLGAPSAKAGTYGIVGADGFKDASEGDLLVVGRIVTLTVTETPKRYRTTTVGDVRITGGSFTLKSVEKDRYDAEFTLKGTVEMREGGTATDFTVDATTWGIREIKKVPSVTTR